MRIALVHDDLIQYGGAERLFEAMVEIWPEAPVFVSMATFKPQTSNLKPQTSFMQKFPFKERLYRYYFLLYPLAFESLDFSQYDVIISSSTRFAHGIITKPKTLHICYMNTPPRMFWEPRDYFSTRSDLVFSFLSPFLSYLRLWDYTAAQRVDYFIANSRTPQKRIKKYYGRDSTIIYPFVDLRRFQKNSENGSEQLRKLSGSENSENSVSRKIGNSGLSDVSGTLTRRGTDTPSYSELPSYSEFSDYFLVVSRLTAWKRIDIAIKAFNKLRLPLKIIGEGPDLKRLRKMAGPTVEFLGRLTDKEVVSYYKNCQALIFPQEEDFGIVPLEAMAAGKPVIALRAGGALETVIEGKTGEFFYPQTAEALVKVLSYFDTLKYQSKDCRKQAARFSKERFKRELKGFVEGKFTEYRKLFV